MPIARAVEGEHAELLRRKCEQAAKLEVLQHRAQAMQEHHRKAGARLDVVQPRDEPTACRVQLGGLPNPCVDESAGACGGQRKTRDAFQTVRSNAARTAGRA